MSIPNPNEDLLQISEEQIQLLERLSNASGVSGDEGEVRQIVLEAVRPAVEGRSGEVKVDALGNVLVRLRGEGSDQLRVMVAAHMDEVGLMIIHEEDRGIFRFGAVGGLDDRYLTGKPVVIGHSRVAGVIGAKPIHLTERDETKNILKIDSLRIDAGSNTNKVKIGDRAVFATSFSRRGPVIRGKALDNRLGVAALIELVKNPPSNIDLLAAFTVQEEVGLRGARVAAYALDPEIAIVLDSTPANDLPTESDEYGKRPENLVYNSRLGDGPAIYVADAGTLSDPRLVRYLIETAERNGIPYQIRQPGGGGTDAGIIHRQRAGIPSVSVSVPSRYQHTPVSIARISDFQHTLALISTALRGLTRDILAEDR